MEIWSGDLCICWLVCTLRFQSFPLSPLNQNSTLSSLSLSHVLNCTQIEVTTQRFSKGTFYKKQLSTTSFKNTLFQQNNLKRQWDHCRELHSKNVKCIITDSSYRSVSCLTFVGIKALQEYRPLLRIKNIFKKLIYIVGSLSVPVIVLGWDKLATAVK